MAGVEVDMVREWMREELLKPVSGPKVDLYYGNLFLRKTGRPSSGATRR